MWAIDSKLVFSKFFDLICNCVFLIISYDFFVNSNFNKKDIIKIFLFIGFLFSAYVLLYYGITNYFKMLLAGRRIGTEIINVNFIGMVGALTFIIALYMLLNSLFKYRIFGLLVLGVSLLVLLGSGSKKALLCVLIGFVSMLFMEFKNKLTYKKFLKLFFIIILFVIGYYLISKISYFSNIFSRLNRMFDTLKDDSIASGSTYIRKRFIEVGFRVFLEHPLLGIGLDNSSYITYEINRTSSYLHCNYIELLACTGIVGFVLYYYMYIKTMLEVFKTKNSYFKLVLVILISMLFLDIGVVSYYEIRCSMYFVLCFILCDKKFQVGDINKEIVDANE